MVDANVVNTSGQGKTAVIPPDIRGWNWGAFLLTWVWGVGNQVWIALVALIPWGMPSIIMPLLSTIYERVANQSPSADFALALFYGTPPLLYMVMAIVLGVKGNRWAWKNKKWDSVEHFKKAQRKWGIWGAIAVALWVILFVGFVWMWSGL